MGKAAVLLTTLLLATGVAIAAPAAHKTAAAQSKVFTGEIWDQTCAKRGSHASMAKQAGIPKGPNMARECTLKCHEMGSPLVLFNPADKHIYKLDDEAKAKPFAGEKVKITGTLDERTGTIHIESIAAAS
jgi:hypothetical protein